MISCRSLSVISRPYAPPNFCGVGSFEGDPLADGDELAAVLALGDWDASGDRKLTDVDDDVLHAARTDARAITKPILCTTGATL